ncbi:MAG: hypothetical protein ACXVRE_10945 [Gaiellaceae bacterium]
MRGRLSYPFLLAVALWLGLAGGLAAVTSRVSDWFVMTDELLYERLALSVDRLHSPLPHVHAQLVPNVNQLYPWLLSIVFRHGAVLHGFHEAHVLDAFVMSSAAVPAYLLARRVAGKGWLALVVSVATAAVPWITLSSFLLTEVVAYPAFVWAALAMQRAIARPTVRNDLLAVAAIAVAVLARTQFYALAAALPVAVLAVAATERSVRRTVRAHLALIVAYIVAGLAALSLAALGHNPLGTYSQTTGGNLLPSGIVGSTLTHIAIVALAGGLVPFLVGGAWCVSNLRRSESSERTAFAWLAFVTVALLTVEVSSFDLRFGGGTVRDRYLFYVTPLLLCAFAAGLTAARGPRRSLVLPLAVLAAGFWKAQLPSYTKLNVDTPASVLNHWLVVTMQSTHGARIFLILAACVVALLYLECAIFLRQTHVAIGLSVLLLAALPAETGYAFERLFAVNGTSGLPMTLDQSMVFGWVDREITTHSEALMMPYPVIRGDYWSNVGFWWDLEFWNRSVDREAAPSAAFANTPAGTFPKLHLRLDAETGKANIDLDSYVVQAADDARFHIAGRTLTTQRGVSVVLPSRPWHADWVSYGLYDDGWTQPGKPARIRVFAAPGQRGAVRRTLTIALLAAGDVVAHPALLRSNEGLARVVAAQNAAQQAVTVCVPAKGYADVTLTTAGSFPIYGDQATAESVGVPRQAGVLVDWVSLAAPGPSCVPGSRQP